jgi:hypothetical protein
VLIVAPALAAARSGPESLGVLAVAEPPGPAPELVELSRRLQGAVAELVRGVIPPDELAARMSVPTPSSSLVELEHAYARAVTAYESGRFESVPSDLEAVLEEVERLPDSPEAFALWSRVVQRLARTEAALGRRSEAARLLSRLVHADPTVQVDPRQYPPSFVRQVESLRAERRAEPHRNLTVSSDRPATVFVEGRAVGTTPVTVSLAPGAYRLAAAAGDARLPRRTVTIAQEHRTVALDFAGAAALRPDAGPGLALASTGRAAAIARVGASLGLDRAIAVTGEVSGGGRWLVASLHDLRRGRLVREARIRLTGWQPPADGVAALAAYLVSGEPSELVLTGKAPPPEPPAALVLHYHRPDGRYEGLRLVTWDAVIRASLRERQPRWTNIPGSGFPGELPSGRDDFGVYWRVPGEFASGRINFILVWGGGFPSAVGLPQQDFECPQLPHTQYWILADGKEAWLSSAGCEVSASEAAARAQVAPAGRAGPNTGAPLASPQGTFTLHYFRRDGRYDDVRLVTWESFASPAQLRGAETALIPSGHPPISPAGRDAFGVYWRIPAAGFRNGRINFFAMKGLDLDECRGTAYHLGTARFWILADGPEAWMNLPECDLFSSEEAAVRYRGKY